MNPGLTTGRENYGCSLESLQRACIICLSPAHCEYKYTCSYHTLAHSLLTQRLHIRRHGHTHTYHLLSLGGSQRTEWTLCSVNFWPVPFEDLLSQLFIYLYSGRAKYSLSLSHTLFLSLLSFSISLSSLHPAHQLHKEK